MSALRSNWTQKGSLARRIMSHNTGFFELKTYHPATARTGSNVVVASPGVSATRIGRLPYDNRPLSSVAFIGSHPILAFGLSSYFATPSHCRQVSNDSTLTITSVKNQEHEAVLEHFVRDSNRVKEDGCLEGHQLSLNLQSHRQSQIESTFLRRTANCGRESHSCTKTTFQNHLQLDVAVGASSFSSLTRIVPAKNPSLLRNNVCSCWVMRTIKTAAAACRLSEHSSRDDHKHPMDGGRNGDDSDESTNSSETEDWLHPDERSDSILAQDPELKSVLRELASDFGRDHHDDESPAPSITDTSGHTDDPVDDGSFGSNRKVGGGNLKIGVMEIDESLEPISVNEPVNQEKRYVFSIDDLVSILREENAQDLCVIKIPKERRYVDYFVVVTARSPRHLKAMSLHINQQYKARKSKQNPFVLVEGDQTEDWMCIDFGNIVLHLMSEETREFYELEKLWTLGPEYDEQLRRLKEFEVKMNATLDMVKPETAKDESPSPSERGDDDGPKVSFVK